MTDEENIRKSNELKLEILLKNIGYGVATNVKFYSLSENNKILGCQDLNDNINQKLFTTFDIASSEDKKVQFVIQYNSLKPSSHQFICVYQDLNHNIYNFVFLINIKSKNRFDYFSYQPSSLSYQRFFRENKTKISQKFKEYKNL